MVTPYKPTALDSRVFAWVELLGLVVADAYRAISKFSTAAVSAAPIDAQTAEEPRHFRHQSDQSDNSAKSESR